MSKSIALFAFVVVILYGCATTYIEFKGECVMQQWQFLGQTMRNRTLCDLPPPELYELQVRDREQMSTNPFPDFLDFDNEADSVDPNLLEKNMGVPQEEPANDN